MKFPIIHQIQDPGKSFLPYQFVSTIKDIQSLQIKGSIVKGWQNKDWQKGPPLVYKRKKIHWYSKSLRSSPKQQCLSKAW